MEEVYYDTSVILEPYEVALKSNKKEFTFKRYCQKLLNYSAGKDIQPVISVLVLGEIKRRISETKDSRALSIAEQEIKIFLDKCRIISIIPESIAIANRVLIKNPRLGQHAVDVLHFSIAMSHKIKFYSIELGIISDKIIIEESKESNVNIIDGDYLLKQADKNN